MKVTGIVEMFSKDKGSVKINDKWISPDAIFKEIAKQICQSGYVKIGYFAELEVNSAGFFTSLKASNAADMSKEEFANGLKSSIPEFKNGSEAKQDKPDKFNKVELTEQTLELFKTKAELTVALALHTISAYKNQTGKTEISEKDVAIIDSCLKATLWK